MKIKTISAALFVAVLLAACGQSQPVPDGTPTDAVIAQATPPALPSGAKACFYEDINYGGRSFCAGANSSWVGNFWNDRISSFTLAPAYYVRLYRDINYAGGSLDVSAGQPNLVNLGFNDVGSSFKLCQNGVPCP